MSSNFANNGKARRKQAEPPALKVIALARVSTEKQKNLSPFVQIERIRAWATAMGYEVLEELSDVGSGRKAERVGLKRAVALAVEHKAILVTYDMSRLFRDARHMLNTFDLLEREGAAYASVADQLTTMDGSATAKLFRTVLGAICQFQSDMSGEKVAASNRATVKKLGYRTNGKQPVGYALHKTGKKKGRRKRIGKEERWIATVLYALELNKKYEFGKWHRTAKLLNEWGVPTFRELRGYKHGTLKWTRQAVQNTTKHFKLKRKRYGKRAAPNSPEVKVKDERPVVFRHPVQDEQ